MNILSVRNEGRLFLKRFHFVPILLCKVCKNYFINMFLQIISITPWELAFNSLETHGLHVHTGMLILCCFTAFIE